MQSGRDDLRSQKLKLILIGDIRYIVHGVIVEEVTQQ